jgi:hypothetical protein
MYQTFYTLVFEEPPIAEVKEMILNHYSEEVKITEASLVNQTLMIETNCTVRELIRFLAEALGYEVEKIGLIIRNETWEPNWSKLNDK